MENQYKLGIGLGCSLMSSWRFSSLTPFASIRFFFAHKTLIMIVPLSASNETHHQLNEGYIPTWTNQNKFVHVGMYSLSFVRVDTFPHFWAGQAYSGIRMLMLTMMMAMNPMTNVRSFSFRSRPALWFIRPFREERMRLMWWWWSCHAPHSTQIGTCSWSTFLTLKIHTGFFLATLVALHFTPVSE